MVKPIQRSISRQLLVWLLVLMPTRAKSIITQNRFYRYTLWIMFLFSCTTFSQEQYNILWVTVEDMSPRLGCYGDHTVATPNIDRLAQEGVRYTNAYVQSPYNGLGRKQ